MAREKKPTRKDKEATPIRDDLKIRVLNAKKHLPKSGVTSLFFHYFGDEYIENFKNKARLNNVLQVRTTDENITEKLEKLVAILTPSD